MCDTFSLRRSIRIAWMRLLMFNPDRAGVGMNAGSARIAGTSPSFFERSSIRRRCCVEVEWISRFTLRNRISVAINPTASGTY